MRSLRTDSSESALSSARRMKPRGDQQKAILARWLLTDPGVLILDEPTRGIDIGVKAEFYDMIGDLAASGRAIACRTAPSCWPTRARR